MRWTQHAAGSTLRTTVSLFSDEYLRFYGEQQQIQPDERVTSLFPAPTSFPSPKKHKRHTCVGKGIGVDRDPARARELYNEACDAGSTAAAYFLGNRFHVGDEDLGIEADGARALRLLRYASEQVHRLSYPALP